MTLAEFLSWQAYAIAKRREQDRQAAAPPLPELGAMGPGGVARAIGGR
jgi:hypothetical protein